MSNDTKIPAASPAQTPGGTADRVPGEIWALAVVVALGGFTTALTSTVVNAGREALGSALDASPNAVGWVATAYLIAFAAGIPATGWMARQIGPRRLWLGTLAVFTVASVLCALAPNVSMLVAARVVQGIAGGFLVPAGQAILAMAAGPKRVGRVMSVVGIPVVLAPILGPTVGALLIEHASWHWLFWINVPVGVLAFAFGWRMLPTTGRGGAGPLDVVGTVLVVTGLPLLTYGAAEIGIVRSFTDWRGLGPVLGALVLLAVFVRYELRVDKPLLNLRLFANIPYASAGLTLFSLGMGLFGPLIIMPLYFTILRGESAVWAGTALLADGLGAVIALPLAGRLTDRIGGGPVVTAGLVVSSVAGIGTALLGAHTPYVWVELLLFGLGFGVGLASAPAMAAAFAVIPREAIPHATPQLNMLQRTGSSFGSALLSVILINQLTSAGPSVAEQVDAFSLTNWVVAAATAVAIVPALLLWRAEARMRAATAGAA